MSTPRIVSLLPSATEIIGALGLEAHLVGISHACDYPASIVDRPRLTAAVAGAATARPQAGLSAFHIDTEQLQALAPDVIVAQAPCELGAVSSAEVVSLHPQLLQDIWADIRAVGRATGRLQQADAVLATCFERVNELIAETIMIPEPPRVAAIAWLEPLMLAGNWMPELIQLAGGRDGLCQPGAPPSTADWEALRAYDPEVLMLMPCGYALEQALAQASALGRLPGWERLTAVRQGHVYAVDGQAYLHRPGPRIVDALELLSALVHPEMFGEFLEGRDGTHCRIE